MTVEYLLGDHLGSTSLTTDTSGAKVSEIRYRAWGEIRYSWTSGASTTPAYKLSSYTYTGQFSYMDDPTTQGTTEGFGLMFYNARWYDPYLSRFAQADTIIPEQTQGVQAWDRYAYANNNPALYSDPSGHFAWIPVLAIAGAAIGGISYIYNESRQPDGFSLQSDWKDLAVAAGTGAVAGALIGSGVGAAAGTALFTAGITGAAMGSASLLDHYDNFMENEDFSASEHIGEGLQAAALAATSTSAAGGLLQASGVTLTATNVGLMSGAVAGGITRLWQGMYDFQVKFDPTGKLPNENPFGDPNDALTEMIPSVGDGPVAELVSRTTVGIGADQIQRFWRRHGGVFEE